MYEQTVRGMHRFLVGARRLGSELVCTAFCLAFTCAVPSFPS